MEMTPIMFLAWLAVVYAVSFGIGRLIRWRRGE
jgi:hypothetical protein